MGCTQQAPVKAGLDELTPSTTNSPESSKVLSVEETKLENAKSKYGSLKINTFIKECESKFAGTTYHTVITRPEPSNASDYSTWQVFVLDPFLRNYGNSTEVVITVAKTLRNRFNEEYKDTFDCKFEGAPHWRMVKNPQPISLEKTKTPSEVLILPPPSSFRDE
jgi:hypothetical protein